MHGSGANSAPAAASDIRYDDLKSPIWTGTAVLLKAEKAAHRRTNGIILDSS